MPSSIGVDHGDVERDRDHTCVCLRRFSANPIREQSPRMLDREQLPAYLDVDVEADQLVGPLFYRALVMREPLDESFVDSLVDCFLARVQSGWS